MAKKASTKSGKAIEAKAGAGPALAKRSKDAKETTTTSPKKSTPAKATAAKAGARDAVKKPSSAKAAGSAKTAGAAKTTAVRAAKPAKSKAASPSIATKVIRKVKATAGGAVALAASVMGKDDKKAKAKRG